MQEQPITYKPKDNHPWRRYRNKAVVSEAEKEANPRYSLKGFMSELVNNWDTYTIPSSDPSAFGEAAKVKYMRDAKIAEWLVDIVRRNWLQ